jgi:hypothetical protein
LKVCNYIILIDWVAKPFYIEKWQLLQTLLSAIQKDTMPPQTTPEKTYPLRGLPITISDDFDEPMPELWEALAE